MDRNHAIKVLSALAQGVDPATGESYPEDSPYNRIDIIRPLFFAVECLRYESQPADASGKWRSNVKGVQKQADSAADGKKAEPVELVGSQIDLFEKLRKWRTEQAQLEGISSYMVLSNDSLARIASILPGTTEELSKVRGFGDIKLMKYSELILALLDDFKQALPDTIS